MRQNKQKKETEAVPDQNNAKPSSIFELLEEYYRSTIWRGSQISDDDLCYDDDFSFSEELTQPVETRKSKIGDRVIRLLKDGYDINDISNSDSALMALVGNADAPMTKFLIEHGADVNKDPILRANKR